MNWSQQVVWITGASSGIGEALAYALSTRGATLVLSARRTEALEQVRAACEAPDRHQVLPLDLADTDALAAAAEAVLARHGRVDVLINNAGRSQRALAKDTAVEVDRQLMAVNYLGTVALTKALLPSMLARQAGHIVVVSSLVGKFGTPMRSGYAASKHALHGFFDALRAEVHDAGLRVTLVCPGFIRTQISVNALVGDGTAQGSMDRGQAQGMPAPVFAEKMIRALERGKAEVYIGGRERLGVYVKRFLPALFRRMIRKAKVT